MTGRLKQGAVVEIHPAIVEARMAFDLVRVRHPGIDGSWETNINRISRVTFSPDNNNSSKFDALVPGAKVEFHLATVASLLSVCIIHLDINGSAWYTDPKRIARVVSYPEDLTSDGGAVG